MKRFLITVATLGMLALAVPPRAGASEARSQALLYNLGFTDQTDIFMFPQLLPHYQGLYLHLPPAISNVYGGIVYNFAADSALGLFVHRPLATAFDQYRLSSTGDTNFIGFANFNGGAAQQPHLAGQLFDLMYGTGTWGAGLRLHLWSETSSQDAPLADPAEAATAITAELYGGFRIFDGLDMRAAVGIRSLADTYFALMFRAGARYLTPGQSRVRAVFASQLEFGLSVPDSGDNSFAFCLPLKGGMKLTAIKDVLYVSLLGGLELQMFKPGGGDTRFGLVAPVVELAAEWNALSWLQVRTGIKGGWGVQFSGDANDNHPKHEQLAFSSGVGIPLGPFTIDAVIQYSLWNSGPYFLGGAPGLFAGVSLSFNWGQGLEQRPAPRPAPAAAPKPAPAPQPKSAAAPKPAPAPKPTPEKPAAGSSQDKQEKTDFEGWEGGE